MAERILADPNIIKPSRYQPFVISHLALLEPEFSAGHYMSLDPVILVREGDNDESHLFDGNNRLMCAYNWRVKIPGEIYRVGESFEQNGKLVLITEDMFDASRISEEIATKYGFSSFGSFPPPTEKPTMKSEIFAELMLKVIQAGLKRRGLQI